MHRSLILRFVIGKRRERHYKHVDGSLMSLEVGVASQLKLALLARVLAIELDYTRFQHSLLQVIVLFIDAVSNATV